MKNRILMLTLSVVLLAGLVGGGTMAWFTDSATNLGNTFTAGTIDIVLNELAEDTTTSIFTFNNIAPGWGMATPHASVIVKIRNNGTLPFQFRGTVSSPVALTGNNLALYNALQGQMRVRNTDQTWPNWGTTWLPTPSLPLIGTSAALLPTGLPPNSTVAAEFRFRLPEGTGNAAQGGSVSLTLSVVATQVGNNTWAE